LKRYSKGARAERELLNYLASIGYSVIRSAGSGVNSISPDVVAVKRGKGIAFESKAWESTSISIEPEKYESLKSWQDNSLMDTYMAWRMNGQGWYFIKLDEMKKTDKSYTVTKKIAIGIGRKLEHIIQP
jgi:Holliday junction resolvase